MFERPTRHLDSLDEESRETLLYTAVVANTLLLFLLVYAVTTDSPVTALWAHPFVWITVGAWAVFRTTPRPASRRTRWLAAVVAAGYFFLLAYVGGLVGPPAAVATGLSVRVAQLPPGWNPAVLYAGESIRFAIVPYTAFGYAVLSYLVYATAVEAEGAVAGGVLGFFSCVSCTLPVVASVLGGFVGATGALTAAVSSVTYGVGTAVFVATVLLLVYRPGLEWLRWAGRR